VDRVARRVFECLPFADQEIGMVMEFAVEHVKMLFITHANLTTIKSINMPPLLA
jgi:hypothetical protein